MHAVFEKEQPTHLTILEIYPTEEAYKSHVKTAHFLKYKEGTLSMVMELELVDTDPLIPELKIK
ncbi:putative quinol monooxygenase [Pedobacter foliorum]|uniref:putative quinol monooxygenase n=1 Tax=Pedobacter foliorum TaxID=2739058 RepID=UPI003744233A